MSRHPSPIWEISINGSESSPLLNDRLIDMSITDARDGEADQLDLRLSDHDGRLEIPPRGAEISISIGWRGESLTPMGVFTVDEAEHSGTPDVLSIVARSADFRAAMADKREQSWHKTTLGALVKTIAKRQQLSPVIARELDAIAIRHIDQTSETDLSFLQRVASMHGAFATVKENRLLFMPAGGGRTASGLPLPPLYIERSAGDRHRFNIADREQCSAVVARYNDTGAAKVGEVRYSGPIKNKPASPIAGETGNTLNLRHCYASKASAERAAKSAWQKSQRGMAEFSITLALGRAELKPEHPAVVSGFKQIIDSERWLIKRVLHSISGSGFTTSLDLEIQLDQLE